MRKFGIVVTSLLLIAILGVMVYITGILTISPTTRRPKPLEVTNLFTTKQQEVQEEVAPSKAVLFVNNPLGQVVIQGAEVDKVQITLSKSSKSTTPSKAKALLEQITLEIETSEEANHLTVKIPKVAQGDMVEADLEIMVPIQTDLDVQADLGQVGVTNLQGNLRIFNKLGGIKVRNVRGDGAFEANLGNIQVTDSAFDRELVALTHLGDLYIEGSLAEKNMLESKLGNLELLLSKGESYILEGTLDLGQFTILVPFKGQQSRGKIQGIIGEGEHKGSIFVNLALGSAQLKSQKEGGDEK